MQPHPEQEFHDPALKDAVRRCWSCDRAPAELRDKISKLITRADSLQIASSGSIGKSHARESGRFRPLGNLSWTIWPIAVAAALLLAVGLFREFQGHSPRGEFASAIPLSLERDLIARHDECCAIPNHQHVAAAINDDAGILNALRAELNRPVVVFHPQDRGWQFHGAAVCPVGTTPAEHLVFVKNAGSLSIFGLPMSVLPAAREGSDYSTNLDQHNIVAFVKDGALFCLVSAGTDGVDIEGLKKMANRMAPAIARAQTPTSSHVLLAELLRPVSR